MNTRRLWIETWDAKPYWLRCGVEDCDWSLEADHGEDINDKLVTHYHHVISTHSSMDEIQDHSRFYMP